jgi:hypothetical protein
MYMELYSEAIKAQKSKTKTDVSQSRDLAVLYGNRSECFLKMSYLDKAMEDAMEQINNIILEDRNPSIYKI